MVSSLMILDMRIAQVEYEELQHISAPSRQRLVNLFLRSRRCIFWLLRSHCSLAVINQARRKFVSLSCGVFMDPGNTIGKNPFLGHWLLRTSIVSALKTNFPSKVCICTCHCLSCCVLCHLLCQPCPGKKRRPRETRIRPSRLGFVPCA